MRGANQPRTVLLISLDTLRVDVAYSGKYPTINKLRSDGTWFRNVVSSAPLTPVSHASVFSGLQPFNHGIRHLFRESLDDKTTTLAEVFREMGYRTGAVVSAPGLNAWYGLNRGFEVYDDELPLLPDGSNPLYTVDVKIRGSAKRRGANGVDRALAWLKSIGDEPCFQFLHFFDCHWPYQPPEDLFSQTANSYESEVAYMDHHLGRYLGELSTMGRLEDSLIICFSDHGEDLAGLYANDHSGSELGHPEESGHGCLLYDVTQLVPLVFLMPGIIPQNLSVDSQVRLVDVAPTIYEMMGITAPHPLDGISLTAAFSSADVNHRIGYSETLYPREQFEASGLFPYARNLRAIRIENRYKVIWEVEGDNVECYDLVNDPNERNPLQPWSISQLTHTL
jgi:arylsulfatase